MSACRRLPALTIFFFSSLVYSRLVVLSIFSPFGASGFFFERSFDACFSKSFDLGFAAGAVSPLFFAAALALAAAILSAFAAAAAFAFTSALPRSCSGA